jgi:hypothetical protein
LTRSTTAGFAFASAIAVGFALTLAGCATPAPSARTSTPQLRLAPALLGHPLNLQQHLTLQAPGREQQLDVLLEADVRHVQMGLVAMGQVAARLDWDGRTLTESKAAWWPPEVSGSRILSDLQLTLWPLEAIQAALPPGWRLAEDGDVRTLTQDGQVVTVITRLAPQVVELDQRREHFKLKIESRDLGVDGAASRSSP